MVILVSGVVLQVDHRFLFLLLVFMQLANNPLVSVVDILDLVYCLEQLLLEQPLHNPLSSGLFPLDTRLRL